MLDEIPATLRIDQAVIAVRDDENSGASERHLMNFSKFLRSFVIGFLGLVHAIGSEQNMKIHCVAAIGVIVFGFVCALAAWEWIAVVLCIGLV